jgi:hypothetical protein
MLDIRDLESLAREMAEAVRAYVGRSLNQISGRLDDLAKQIAAIPSGKDGKDGAIGPQGEAGSKGDVGLRGEKGLDGRDGRDGKDGREGTDGIDGAAGRDAAHIDYLDGIDETRQYPRGTYALYRGGVIVALRSTLPVTGDLAAAGWGVAMNGIAEDFDEILDDGRVFKRKTVYTNGREVVMEIRIPGFRDRGGYRDGEKYSVGDGVTYGGSFWIAQQDAPEGRPDGGAGHWRIAVKKGRDGKDAAPPDTPGKPVVKVA